MNEQFIQVTKRLLKATHVQNRGVTVDLTLTMKIVWSYMRDRWEHFSKGKGYFENQDMIGKALGIDRRTLIRMFTKFEEVGIIVVEKKKLAGRKVSNTYTFVADTSTLDLLFEGKLISAEEYPVNIQPTPKKVVDTLKHKEVELTCSYEEHEEFEPPF